MYLLVCCLRQSVDLVSMLSTSRPAARLDPVTLIRNADTMPMHFIHSLCQTVSGKDQHVEAFFARSDPQIQRGTINQNTHSNLRKRHLHVSHQHSCDQMFDLRSATLRTVAQKKKKKLSALHARMSSVEVREQLKKVRREPAVGVSYTLLEEEHTARTRGEEEESRDEPHTT